MEIKKLRTLDLFKILTRNSGMICVIFESICFFDYRKKTTTADLKIKNTLEIPGAGFEPDIPRSVPGK